MENDDIKTKSNWLNSFCPVAEFYGIQVCPTDAQKATDSTETFHKMQIFAPKSYATKTERTIQKKEKETEMLKKKERKQIIVTIYVCYRFQNPILSPIQRITPNEMKLDKSNGSKQTQVKRMTKQTKH